MSTDTSTAKSANRTTVPNWDKIPCVQDGFPEGKGPKRSPKLNTIFDPIPEGANTASPIYIVPKERYKQQRDKENPYRVSGDYNLLATEVQDECENDDSSNRVLYPIHVESDEYHREGPETLIRWIREFIEDCLEIPIQTCKLYFSGSRSIHAHVPRFVQHDDIARLKDLAETFCEETGAKLDCGIYSRKRIFRLPGVVHRKTGFAKIEIQPEWEEDQIIQALSQTPDVPESYEAVLRDVFLPHTSSDSPSAPTDAAPHELFRSLSANETLLEFPDDETENEIEVPLIEQYKEDLDNPYDIPRWVQYNGPQFSPYALAEGNPRSVAAVKVEGGAFARKHRRGGAPMVPARFFGAVGCDGQFTKETEHGPLQLSEGAGKDYEKWSEHGFEVGDYVVIIGGQSRSSIIHAVSKVEALQTGYHLIREKGGRQAALTYLSESGYDTGAAGTDSYSERKTSLRSESLDGEANTVWPARENPQTDAEAFQRIAEQEGIDNLSYPEINIIAHRHLRYGWEAAWEWVEEQYGAEFDPAFTWNQFRSIVEGRKYDEYNEVTVPKKPV